MTTINLDAPKIRVSGAGLTEIDGIYILCNELYQNAPQWKHESKDYWLFWFNGGWEIGHLQRGNCAHYSSYPSSIGDSVKKRDYVLLNKLMTTPFEIPTEGWEVVGTGYNPPKFTGGIGPAPHLESVLNK
jgi:hypothetical protein